MFVKGFSLFLVVVLLSGCASYIANEIASPQTPQVTGNISEWTIENTFCDAHSNCMRALSVKDNDLINIDLSFSSKINDNHKIWQYKYNIDEALPLKPLNKQLIFIFAGYSQPTEILYIHQAWLQYITGADVFVIPSADNSENFQFGLDFVSPIVAEIKRRQPEKVHLVGFSMGAVAAHAVAEQTKNSRLHLIAPMTDFKQATKALWKILYSKKFYTKLISIDTIEEAVEIIHKNSKTPPENIDIIRKIQSTTIPTYVYASMQDRVTLASHWENVNAEAMTLKKYEQLNHLEMVALLNQGLLVDFTSQLIGRKVLKSEIETIGLMCDGADVECLDKMK